MTGRAQIKAALNIRRLANEQAHAAIAAHLAGDAAAVDKHLKEERRLIAQLREEAPEFDLRKQK